MLWKTEAVRAGEAFGGWEGLKVLPVLDYPEKNTPLPLMPPLLPVAAPSVI